MQVRLGKECKVAVCDHTWIPVCFGAIAFKGTAEYTSAKSTSE